MLNPDKIKEKEFQTTGRGSYRADDVDSFLSKTSQRWLRVSSGLGCHHLPIIKVIWWNCIQRAVVWKIFLVR